MKFLIFFSFCFSLTMMLLEFKKSFDKRGFTHLMLGKVMGIKIEENGVFFEIEYKDKSEENHTGAKVYSHKFTNKNLSEEKIQILAEHYIGTPFYLLAKKDNLHVVAVTGYNNSKSMRWVYLFLSLVIGYFLIR